MEHLNIKHLYAYLKQFGLSTEEIDIYVLLATKGPLSALQLAKQSGLSRTQIYRYLERLTELNLANPEKLSYGTIYTSLDINNLEAELESRELRARKLQQQLPLVSNLLKSISGSPRASETVVRSYYGMSGIKQANWNLSKASKEFRVFEQDHLNNHLKDTLFTKRLKERFIEKGLKTYDLTNSEQVTATDIEPVNLENSKVRYISPELIDISFEVYIYDHTVTLLDYTPDKMTAVEIINPNLAKMMSQTFDALWALGKEPRII